MKNKFTPLVLLALIFSLTITGCGGGSSNSNTPGTTIKTDSKSTNQNTNTKKEETSINGVYTGSQNISGLELTARLTVSGNRWSATSQITGDSPEYQNGIVQGSDLYDDSGSIKIGYVSGNTARIDGYPSMSK
jgi:hypothetical protein